MQEYMMKYESESRLIKCRQAAAYLGICERKLWELEKNGRVPSVRIDRAVRFDITDLDAFIQQSKNNEK
jgi:excisionase family DNA binding protein